jgi:pimeloyl-ACP methyl ester carboxylesterase
VTYNVRGYPPSSVPEDRGQYSEEQNVEDLRGLLDHLGLLNAHIVGLSQGGALALKFGIKYPDRCRSLVVAGAGTGSGDPAQFARDSDENAARFEREGMEVAGLSYGSAPTRIPFLRKDPRGWAEFIQLLRKHSTPGSANTARGVQGRRKSIYAVEESLPDMRVPTLIMVGDEDEPCLDVALFLKRRLPNAGLAIFPKSGHTINIEEPALFNQQLLDFLSMVEHNRWIPRDAPYDLPDLG